MMFYVCLGKIPKEVIELPFKKNSSFTFVLIISFIFHIYMLCRFAIQNFQEKNLNRLNHQIYPYKIISETEFKRSPYLGWLH